jgi:hypothetical protein
VIHVYEFSLQQTENTLCLRYKYQPAFTVQENNSLEEKSEFLCNKAGATILYYCAKVLRNL